MMNRKCRGRVPISRTPVLAIGLGLLSACQLGGTQVIIPETCMATLADLQGTWIISHVIATLTCPAGVPLQTTSTGSRFTPVTVVRNESPPGFTITATGLTAKVEDVTCNIVWTYLDKDTNARFDCDATYSPDSRTAGGTTEAGHCRQVTPLKKDGTPLASCAIPSPYLDTFIVIEGP